MYFSRAARQVVPNAYVEKEGHLSVSDAAAQGLHSDTPLMSVRLFASCRYIIQ